jgi:hypothetical protein
MILERPTGNSFIFSVVLCGSYLNEVKIFGIHRNGVPTSKTIPVETMPTLTINDMILRPKYNPTPHPTPQKERKSKNKNKNLLN